jgi:hypothetical protein
MPYPYMPSGGIFQQAVEQFRKTLPSKVDSTTLKKLGIAPSNEGYVIATLKFLGILDSENNRTDAGVELFTTHGEAQFAKGLGAIVRDKYGALFDLRGDDAWTLDRDSLISFFRGSDKTSAIVGARQAITFAALAGLAGQREEAPKAKPASAAPKHKKQQSAKPVQSQTAAKKIDAPLADSPTPKEAPVGLTVRIEINLPANGTQATYDNIFKSIRQNLLNQ